MPLEFCHICKSMHYTTDACRPKPLERAATSKATEPSDKPSPVARSTPSPKPNRNAYSAKYMREVYRPRLKARALTGVNNG